MGDNSKVGLDVVYNKDGSIRCVYLNDTRVVGGKPYVSEGLRQQHLEIEISRIINALPRPAAGTEKEGA